MTTMNTNERDERLKQIRERLKAAELAPHAPDEWWSDIGWLLSELEAEHSLGLMRNAMRESAEKEAGELRAELAGKQQVINELIAAAKTWEDEAFRLANAATRMRDKCVGKVRELEAAWLGDSRTEANDDRSNAAYEKCCAARAIAKDLESLTLDQGEQKQ